MGRQSRIVASLLVLACASSSAWANRKFNIHDDLLAFPQFQIHFPDGYVLDSQARALLQLAHGGSTSDDSHLQTTLSEDSHDATHDETRGEPKLSYEELILEDQRYLCQIPRVESSESNRTKGPRGVNEEEEERKELARATDRGLELLRDMEGKCLYYISGWWSYSFCYMNQIKQFHALPSGGGIPNYPPMEDPTTHAFILGRFPHEEGGDDGENDRKTGGKATTDLAELQTRGGSRYLVQHLDGGDQCDLTGRNRKIEVQFHCNPQSTDRIGWIKELTTCSYLMLVYTPRLCNDVAFLPPQQDEVHTIECREILAPEEVSDWEALHEYHLSQRLVESAGEQPEFPIVGGIEVGAQRLVGSEGKQIEKGRVASVGEEKVSVVAKRVDGEVQSLSAEELKKLDLDPERIESLKEKLDEAAKGKDWTLEFVTSNGERGLRGFISPDEEDEEEEKGYGKDKGQETSSEEHTEKNRASSDEEARTDHQDKKDEIKEDGGDEQPTPGLGDTNTGSKETFKDEL